MFLIIQVHQLAKGSHIILSDVPLLLHGDEQDSESVEDHLFTLLPINLLLEVAVQILRLLLSIQYFAADGM